MVQQQRYYLLQRIKREMRERRGSHKRSFLALSCTAVGEGGRGGGSYKVVLLRTVRFSTVVDKTEQKPFFCKQNAAFSIEFDLFATPYL